MILMSMLTFQLWEGLGITQNPYLKTELISEEYSPYFTCSSSKSTLDSFTESEKENWNPSPHVPTTTITFSSQETVSSTTNPFINPNRLTLPPKRKTETKKEYEFSKHPNLGQFIYSIDAVSG
jgi:hypothetical protein